MTDLKKNSLAILLIPSKKTWILLNSPHGENVSENFSLLVTVQLSWRRVRLAWIVWSAITSIGTNTCGLDRTKNNGRKTEKTVVTIIFRWKCRGRVNKLQESHSRRASICAAVVLTFGTYVAVCFSWKSSVLRRLINIRIFPRTWCILKQKQSVPVQVGVVGRVSLIGSSHSYVGLVKIVGLSHRYLGILKRLLIKDFLLFNRLIDFLNSTIANFGSSQLLAFINKRVNRFFVFL